MTLQPGDRWRFRETTVFWALGVATGCRQCEPAVTQVEPGLVDCKLGCNQRESGGGFSGSDSELASGLIASWGGFDCEPLQVDRLRDQLSITADVIVVTSARVV